MAPKTFCMKMLHAVHPNYLVNSPFSLQYFYIFFLL